MTVDSHYLRGCFSHNVFLPHNLFNLQERRILLFYILSLLSSLSFNFFHIPLISYTLFNYSTMVISKMIFKIYFRFFAFFFFFFFFFLIVKIFLYKIKWFILMNFQNALSNVIIELPCVRACFRGIKVSVKENKNQWVKFKAQSRLLILLEKVWIHLFFQLWINSWVDWVL